MTLQEIFKFASKKREDAFQQFFYKQDLLICRAASSLVMMIMIALIVIDSFRLKDFSWVIIARLIVFTVLAILLLLTYHKKMTPRRLQLSLMIINIVFLASLFFMEATTEMPPFYLPNSVVVFIFIVNTVSGLRYRYTVPLVVMLVTLFIIFPTENGVFHKSQIPNIVISSTVSLLIGFIWERHKRINFRQQTQLNNILNIFSHDMVSPMNSLLSLLSLSDRHLIEKEELDLHVASIKRTTTNNILLLQNLVKWSKSQLDGFKPNPEPIDLNALVQDTINLMQPAAAEKNITIQNQQVQNYKCLADMEMTKLILRNTLSNALKFSHPNGTIVVTSRRDDANVSISIKDNGVGMTPEETERLFTMTVQSTPGTANERGTGIGLYITREFVSLNKGHIKIESVKGSGSTITISLPGTF